MAASFGLSTLILMVAGKGAPVAACAGVVIGLGNRLWSLITGFALLGWVSSHAVMAFDPVSWAVPAVLLLAGAFPSPWPLPRPSRVGIAVMPLCVSGAILIAILVAHSIVTTVMTLIASGVAGLASLLIVRRVAGEGPTALAAAIPRFGHPSSTAHYLLVGRITGGLFHELSQSLNVIMMANSNLGYIVNKLDIGSRDREELVTRVDRITAHSDAAAVTLGLLRWFGRDGSRDQGPMSLGDALQRAIAVTHPDARAAGLAIELRGDALDYPALVRHGTVEMIAVAALLDLLGGLPKTATNESESCVVIDASHADGGIVVSLLCEQLPSDPNNRSDIDRVTFDLANGFARECGGSLTRISRRNDPVQLAIMLNRAAI